MHPIFANGHHVLDRMLQVGSDEVLDAETQTEPAAEESVTDDANDNSQSSDDESNAELVFITSEDATFL